MIIKEVKKEFYYRYIIVKGEDGIIEALNKLGTVPSSHATHETTMHDLEASYATGGLLFAMMQPRNIAPSSPFIKRLMSDIKARLDKGDEYHYSFDYDGPGPFFKTSVDVFSLPEDLYGVGFNAAYVGEKPESDLARALNLPRALRWGRISLITEPTADGCFSFDFKEIVQRLATAIPVLGRGKRMAQMLCDGDKFNGILIPFYHDGLFQGVLSLGLLGIMPQYESPWIADGSTLIGKWSTQYGKQYLPTIELSVSKIVDKKQSWRNAPHAIYKTEERAQLVALVNKIEQAFL